VGQDVLVVANAGAGSARRAAMHAVMVVLRAAAAARGTQVDLVVTASPERLRATLGRIAGRRLVVVGGDGSIHAAVQALHDDGRLREVGPIGIVPMGTGNDLAGALGLPTDPASAARVAVNGTVRDMELLVADDGGIAVNAVHVGIGAAAVAKAAGLKRRLGRVGLGRLAFPVGAVAAGLTESVWQLTVDVDGRTVHDGEQPVLMVALGLAGTIGGGAPLAPRADPRDGLVDVVVSRAVGPIARLGYGLDLLDGAHLRRHDVLSCRGRVVEVRAVREPFVENCDGDLQGPFAERRWHTEAGAWQVLVPPTRRRR
jgi:diacylglycerol kinase (ATP)